LLNGANANQKLLTMEYRWLMITGWRLLKISLLEQYILPKSRVDSPDWLQENSGVCLLLY
jgi:hypothetical protein